MEAGRLRHRVTLQKSSPYLRGCAWSTTRIRHVEWSRQSSTNVTVTDSRPLAPAHLRH